MPDINYILQWDFWCLFTAVKKVKIKLVIVLYIKKY